MRKIIASAGIALDGVFEAETMGKWAAPFYSEERDEYVRGNVLAADTLLLGRTTYDLQAWYWPNQKEDKYGIANHKNNMAKYVITSRPLQAQWNNSTIIKKNVVEEIAKLKQQPGKDIIIDGSATLVQSLQGTGLIDEYRLLVEPFIMGRGRRFFEDGTAMSKLHLVESKTLKSGTLALIYQPADK